jgi:hypothetical protein
MPPTVRAHPIMVSTTTKLSLGTKLLAVDDFQKYLAHDRCFGIKEVIGATRSIW